MLKSGTDFFSWAIGGIGDFFKWKKLGASELLKSLQMLEYESSIIEIQKKPNEFKFNIGLKIITPSIIFYTKELGTLYYTPTISSLQDQTIYIPISMYVNGDIKHLFGKCNLLKDPVIKDNETYQESLIIKIYGPISKPTNNFIEMCKDTPILKYFIIFLSIL